MNYLFFDLECSNCYNGNGKICEFGYVLVDENFKILKHFDFPINPGTDRKDDAKFDLSIFRREPGFEWAYSFDEYFSSPRFPHYYELIKGLLENPNNIVLGWAIENDIGYLKYTTDKYKLESYKFNSIDVKVFSDKYKIDNPTVTYKKLSGAFKYFASPNEFIRLHSHKAEDDSYMTMRVLQELCKIYKKTLKELIDDYPSCKKEASNIKKIRKTKIKKSKTIKEIIEGKQLSDDKRNPGQVKWDDYYHMFLDSLEDPNYVNKKVTISKEVKKDCNLTIDVIKTIDEKGCIPTDSVSKSNYIIVVDDDDKKRMASILKRPYDGKILTLNEFKTIK